MKIAMGSKKVQNLEEPKAKHKGPNTIKINAFLSPLLQVLNLLKLLMRRMCNIQIQVQLTLLIRKCRTW